MTPLQRGQLLASKNAVTDIEINFLESALVRVHTKRVSKYAERCVTSIKFANTMMRTGSWYPWTREWYQQTGKDSMFMLIAMLNALDESGAKLVGNIDEE